MRCAPVASQCIEEHSPRAANATSQCSCTSSPFFCIPINVNITNIAELIFVFCGRSRKSLIHISIRLNTEKNKTKLNRICICRTCKREYAKCSVVDAIEDFLISPHGHCFCGVHGSTKWLCKSLFELDASHCPGRRFAIVWLTNSDSRTTNTQRNRYSQQHTFLISRMYQNNVTLHNAQREICKCGVLNVASTSSSIWASRKWPFRCVLSKDMFDTLMIEIGSNSGAQVSILHTLAYTDYVAAIHWCISVVDDVECFCKILYLYLY